MINDHKNSYTAVTAAEFPAGKQFGWLANERKNIGFVAEISWLCKQKSETEDYAYLTMSMCKLEKGESNGDCCADADSKRRKTGIKAAGSTSQPIPMLAFFSGDFFA